MRQTIKQQKMRTLSKVERFLGKSPFTAGTKSEAIIKPSIKGQIIFYIRDENREWIEVPVDYRHIGKMVGDEHTTRVANGKGDVIHTEHLLSALSGMGIDSCDIYLMRDNQVPVFRYANSRNFSLRFTETKEIDIPRKYFVVEEPLTFEYENSWAIMLPSETFDISAFIQFPDPVGQSYYGIKDLTPDKYLREISWARSFIRSGVSQKTWEKKIMKVIPALPKDMSKSQVLVANEDGYWITPLKRKDELVRHKVLDLIGDLRLLGMPIKGNIHVARPGHEFNRRLVSFLSDIGNYS